jgi:hypothetical protein
LLHASQPLDAMRSASTLIGTHAASVVIPLADVDVHAEAGPTVLAPVAQLASQPFDANPSASTWQGLAEYSSGSLALQDDLYTPSTHTSLESPRNGGINGYFTLEHGLLQGEPSIITSKWGYSDPKGGFITQDTHIYIIFLYNNNIIILIT